MSGGGGEDFRVQPEDLRKTGNSAAQIGDQMLHHGDDVLASAKAVSTGLDGFALTGAFDGCAQAWEDKLESLAHGISRSGERLLTNADTYEKADAAASAVFDAASGGLVPAKD